MLKCVTLEFKLVVL